MLITYWWRVIHMGLVHRTTWGLLRADGLMVLSEQTISGEAQSATVKDITVTFFQELIAASHGTHPNVPLTTFTPKDQGDKLITCEGYFGMLEIHLFPSSVPIG